MNSNITLLAVLLLFFSACQSEEPMESGSGESTTEPTNTSPPLSGLIEYSINGGEINILNDATARIVDNKVLHIFSYDTDKELAFDVQVDLVEKGTAYAHMSLIHGVDVNGEIYRTLCGTQKREFGVVCEGLEMTTSNIGSVGDVIEGTITGFTHGFYPEHEEEISIDASFKVTLNESVISRKVEGKVWNDKNENGLQDEGEAPMSGIRIGVATPRLFDTGYYPGDQPGISDEDGNYVLEGLVSGEEYSITYTSAYEYKITTADAGPDDIDSDFEFFIASPSFDIYTFEIPSFPDSEVVTDVDLGLIER